MSHIIKVNQPFLCDLQTYFDAFLEPHLLAEGERQQYVFFKSYIEKNRAEEQRGTDFSNSSVPPYLAPFVPSTSEQLHGDVRKETLLSLSDVYGVEHFIRFLAILPPFLERAPEMERQFYVTALNEKLNSLIMFVFSFNPWLVFNRFFLSIGSLKSIRPICLQGNMFLVTQSWRDIQLTSDNPSHSFSLNSH
jgi:hypothetical protein